jgi:hypothetical protein
VTVRVSSSSYGPTSVGARLSTFESVVVGVVGVGSFVGLVVLAVAEGWGVLGFLAIPLLTFFLVYTLALMAAMAYGAFMLACAGGMIYLLWLGVTDYLPRVVGLLGEGFAAAAGVLLEGMGASVLSGEFVDLALENCLVVALSGALAGLVVGLLQARGRARSHAAETVLGEASPSLFTRAPEAFGGFLLNVVVGFLVGALQGASGAASPFHFGGDGSFAHRVVAWASPLGGFGGGFGGLGGGPEEIAGAIWALFLLLLAIVLVSTAAGAILGVLVAGAQGAILGALKGLAFAGVRAWFTVSGEASAAAGVGATVRASLGPGAATGALCGLVLGVVTGVATVVAHVLAETG